MPASGSGHIGANRDMAELSGSRSQRRLNSWKEIAAFFGKNERTVKRWEAHGLPVRRVPGGARASVFAYVEELEGWLERGRDLPEARPAGQAGASAATRLLDFLRRRSVGLGLATAISFVAMLLAVADWRPPAHVPPSAAEEQYLAGTYDWNTRTAAGLKQAIEEFSTAIALDPDYAQAYAGLANAYNLISQYTDAPAAESYAKARAAAQNAISLDPRLADAHAALGFNLFYASRDFAGSAAEFETALRLGPRTAQTLHWYALTLMHFGSFDRPVALIDEASKLDPASRAIRANRALILFHAGRAREALAILTALRQEHPDYLATPSYLATIYLDLGRLPEFLSAARDAASVSGDADGLATVEAAERGFAEGGREGLLRQMYAAQQESHAKGRLPAYKLAVTAAMLGDDEAALDWLARSVGGNEPDAIATRIETAFAGLATNPKFLALLRRLGLPAQ